ncbi:MAG: DUF4249 domain-containing protein [Bacteroidota bacterium]
MKKNMQQWTLLLLAALTLSWSWSGCDLEKEVDLNLPIPEPQLVVECFLVPGKPYRLVLTESVPFNAPSTGFTLPTVEDAQVTISVNGTDHVLQNTFVIDPQSGKAFNYASSEIVPADFASTFTLHIDDGNGREISGTTQIMKPVEFDTLFFDINEEDKAAVTMVWPDFPGENNYYRFAVYEDSLLVSEDNNKDGLQFVGTVDDRVGDGEDFTISTFYQREIGDTVILQLLHISEDYWRYFQTSEDAYEANGNPFGQPSMVHNTVEGGFGVFTGFVVDRDSIAILA